MKIGGGYAYIGKRFYWGHLNCILVTAYSFSIEDVQYLYLPWPF